MALDHFSHEHWLNLEDVSEKVKCEACQEQISSESAYCCRSCKFFLHEVCATCPREVTHQMHPQHPLNLIAKCPAGTRCDGCREDCHGFIYNCILCDFDLDIQCALPEQTRNYEHIHHHPLTFQRRMATFECNFCKVKDEDQSYKCYTCPYWIHRKCASMPLTNQLNFHPHPLSLAQGMPEEYLDYGYGCEVCNLQPSKSKWLYYCGPCRYFIHIKCIKVITDQIEAYYSVRDGADYIEDSFFKYLLNDDLVCLPVDNFSVDLIQRFLVEKNSLIDIKHEINHFSHEQHQLILITEQMVNNDEYFQEEDEEILCDGCIDPISAPYYWCLDCNYYLHVPCASLPTSLQHPAHSHELRLYHSSNFHNYFCCQNCGEYTNGFVYGCYDCKFSIDLKCAALPTVFMHETHKHPLIQEKARGDELCDACRYFVAEGNLIFKCKSCDFTLHKYCATLPRSFRHRWDRNHPILLSFPPHHEHPGHIMCDMCEEIIHPKVWLYSCFKCKVCFHQNCPPRLCRDPNIKYGGEVKIPSHTHPLKIFRQPTLKTSCDACGGVIKNTDHVFECETCYACMCSRCVINQIS